MRYYYSPYYSPDNKIVIKCMHCRNNLRVPLDKGKISVSCPVCRKEFIYNPNSIFDTLKQIVLSVMAWVAKSRKNLVIFIAAVLIVLIALFLLFSFGFRNKSEMDMQPELKAYNIMQEYYII